MIKYKKANGGSRPHKKKAPRKAKKLNTGGVIYVQYR